MADALVTVGACVHKAVSALSRSRLSLVRAAGTSRSWLREEREVSRDTGRPGRVPKLARLPRGISGITHRLSLVALATAYPEMDILL